MLVEVVLAEGMLVEVTLAEGTQIEGTPVEEQPGFVRMLVGIIGKRQEKKWWSAWEFF